MSACVFFCQSLCWCISLYLGDLPVLRDLKVGCCLCVWMDDVRDRECRNQIGDRFYRSLGLIYW